MKGAGNYQIKLKTLLSFSRKASDVFLKKNILEKYYTEEISLLQMDFNTYIFSAPARVFLMSSTKYGGKNVYTER